MTASVSYFSTVKIIKKQQKKHEKQKDIFQACLFKIISEKCYRYFLMLEL